MRIERTKNAKRGILFGFFNKIIMLFFPFFLRSLIINYLGVEFLGINGLFTSVLQVLNMTELGFSNAVVFSMYEPIAQNDKNILCSILKFYRRIYTIIGFVILLVGASFVPFLRFFIKGTYPESVNIYIIYLIYLANTVVSYFLFAYKNALLSAYQRVDIASNINTIVHFCIYIVQAFIIVFVKNYYFYTVMFVLATIIVNISTHFCTKRLFPDLFCNGIISENKKQEITTKVKGLFVNKVCGVSRNAFDSIFISAFLGLAYTAIYNNYYYILNGVVSLLAVISPAILGGVGNSIVTETQHKNYEDMTKINFVYMWLSGWCTCCLICLYQPFTEIVFGKDFLLPFPIIILLCVYFYVLKMGDIRSVYSDARGLWWENRYRAISESIANLVLNFVLGRLFGIYGIILATLLSLFFINFCWGSTILYKYYFTEEKVREYYLLHLLYAFVTAFVCIITYFICSRIQSTGILKFIFNVLICVFIPHLFYIIIYFRYSLFRKTIAWIQDVIQSV